jgi:cytochrome c oxidase assembly protein subunit 15
VKLWLMTGILMVFIQVVVGGITRLTESGLSITKWEIVSGTLPPLNEANWNLEFEKYQKTPQYLEINEGMSLDLLLGIYTQAVG